MENLNVENFNEKISKGKVLVDFYADWCGPCKMVTPVLEEIQNENAEVNVYKVNVDEEPQLAAEYGIRSIPAILYFLDGELTDRKVGAQPKSIFVKLIS